MKRSGWRCWVSDAPATVAEGIRAAAARLTPLFDTARLDAELLMAHALGATRSEVLLRHTRDPEPPAFAALIERRMRHEPIAYIIGTQEFYGLELFVNKNVLIPRSDSETLIDAAREAFADLPPTRLLDLGTGSGALLLAALSIWPKAEGLGLDCSIDALIVAIKNAQRHANTPIAFVGSGPAEMPAHRADRGFARFIQGDWTKRGWKAHLGRFDLIISNPPYVETTADIASQVRDHEPAGALFAGPDGLDAYRILIPQLPKLLTTGGVAVLEIGASQADAVTSIASDHGFTCNLRHDLGGRPRALILRLGLGKAGPSG